MEKNDFELGNRGEARTRPDILRVVLGPCAQYYPCEASVQKWGQKPGDFLILGSNFFGTLYHKSATIGLNVYIDSKRFRQIY